MLGDLIRSIGSDRWIRIAIVIGVVNLTNGVNLALYEPRGGLPVALYWLDVGLLSFLFGALEGALTTALSILSVWFFVIPPVFTFDFGTRADADSFGEFAGVALLIYGIAWAGRRLAARSIF